MNVKLLSAGAIVAMAFATSAQATIVTTTSTGTIRYGNDSAGIFGGGSLIGDGFSLSLATDDGTTISDFGTRYARATSGTVTATVNGISYVGAFCGGTSTIQLTNFTLLGGYPYKTDSITGSSSGFVGGLQLSTFQDLGSYTSGFVGSAPDLTATYSHAFTNGDRGSVNFNLSDARGNTLAFFSATPDITSLNPPDQSANVPEPGGIALLGASMLGLGGAASRRKRKGLKDIESEVTAA